jgi:hypothetical protein
VAIAAGSSPVTIPPDPLDTVHRLPLPHPLDIGIRTGAFEILAICAAALTLAGTVPLERPYPAPWESVVCSVIFGIDHILVLGVIASLVPACIPGSAMFWAYLTAAAFVAAGVSMATKWMGRFGGDSTGNHVPAVVLASPFPESE